MPADYNFKILDAIFSGNIHPERGCNSPVPESWPAPLEEADPDAHHVSMDGVRCAKRFTYPNSVASEYERLNPDQRSVFSSVLHNKYNFLSAPAGSGKSFLIDTLAGVCAKFCVPVSITSTTKRSSDNISGTTVHSFSGIGYNTTTTAQIVKKMSKINRARIMGAQLLIIDEISMMSPYFVEKMNALFKIVRKNSSWFGGMRVFMCGDMLQLPIVRKENEPRRELFDIPGWDDIGFVYCKLSMIMRQTDPGFVAALNEIRSHTGPPAQLSIDTIGVIKSMIRPCDPYDSTITYLSGLHRECAEINNRMSQRILAANDNFVFETRIVNCCDSRTASVESVKLCNGIKVIVTGNLFSATGAGITNGTVGTIVDFAKPDTSGTMMSVTDGRPINHRYYCGSHDAMPSSSRAPVKKQLADDIIYCVHGNPVSVSTQLNAEDSIYPVIEVDGDRSIIGNYVKFEYVFNEQTEFNNVTKIITGIPLKIAYAVTVHFSQGCTLNRIAVNVYSLFERQHFYTAISRVRSREDVFIIPGNSYEDQTTGNHSVERVLLYILKLVKYTDPVILKHLARYYREPTIDGDHEAAADETIDNQGAQHV